ncbi:hypothetical protein FHS77_000362 [Paenochrobactrum gallinarii]|uniref:Uncharacterized protein n=1 Tax=Paenochrobactrum gallinarii TaxID=643673 RepID=A0A841M2N0_9HYPH|nr:hypothetical protein [Paenochrobactrum gallinarii]MBB6259854.1 hypothetical protein [Paenochrobactrum gallinarii]
MSSNHAFFWQSLKGYGQTKRPPGLPVATPNFTFAYAQVFSRPLLTDPPPTIHEDVRLVHAGLIARDKHEGNCKNARAKRKLTVLSEMTVFTPSADLYKANPARTEIKIANSTQSPAPSAAHTLRHINKKSGLLNKPDV